MKHIKDRGRGFVVRGQKLKMYIVYLLLFTVHCSLLTVFTGCAPTKSQIKSEEGVKKVAIDKISVIEGGKEILIEASGPITYTAFKLSDPARLMLDIPGADIEKVKAPMDVNNEFINRIVVASYGEAGMAPISRVEIGLKERVASDVKLSEGNILVALNYEVIPQHEAEAPAMVEPKAVEEKISETPSSIEPLQQEIAKKEESIKAAVEETAPAIADVEKKDIKKADKLLKIEAKKEKNITIIKVIGNGSIGDFNAFTIDKPAPSRIVVDVWNVKSSIPGDGLTVNGPYIKKVRVGEYPDKVRLVFDSGQKNVPSYTIERVENSIVITAGKIDIKKLEPAAVAPVAAVSQEPPVVGTAQKPPPAIHASETKKADYAEIKAVDFKQLADKARLIITASKKMEYRLLKLSDETGLALDIKDAIIPDELKRTLDASDLNTAVASISSFQAAATEPAKDVRILIKLKEKAKYDISQQDGNIQIDFPLLAVAAQTVPKMAEVKKQGSEEAKEIKETKFVEEKKEQAQASGYTGRKISLDFKDADISNILRLMAEVSNLNIIAGEDVKGKVSLRLIDVPWDQAFEIILKTNGLGKVQEGNVVRILPLAKIKQESEDVLASQKSKEKLEPLEIKLLAVNYATASALADQVKGLLSDRGHVSIEARTNTLIIKDIPVNIEKAVDMAKKLDTPTPQVLIEARIVEANSNFARDLGVQWGAATLTTSRDQFSSAFGSAATGPSNTLTPITGGVPFVGSGGVFSSQPNFAVSLPASGAAGTLGAMGFSFGKLIGDPFLLDLRISAGEKQGLTKTISRPRIITLNNNQAKISQGDSVPFETTSAAGTQTQFIDATLSLTVTPHITPDGSVSMKIQANRNSIGSFRSAAGTPSISKKEASTEIIVKSGETAVIGGIVVEDKSNTTSGIPWLKEIPIIGWLFKNKSTAESQTELLIFITPNIVKGGVELSAN